MGFSTADNGSREVSILADHVTCELAPLAHTAIELLDLVDQACYAGLVEQVETEIDRGSGSSFALSLVESIYARSRPTGSVEYLELLESEADSFVVPSASPSARSASRGERFLSEADLAELALDRELGSPTSSVALIDSLLERMSAASVGSVDLLEESQTETDVEYARPSGSPARLSSSSEPKASRLDWFVNYLELSEPGADTEEFVAARSGADGEWAIDYHNPSSPWADTEQFVGAPVAPVEFEGFIDYHNPSSPWADTERFYVASERNESRLEWFVNYLELSEPGLEESSTAHGRPGGEWAIDYHNPNSPWAGPE
jgi:hypothetical protein